MVWCVYVCNCVCVCVCVLQDSGDAAEGSKPAEGADCLPCTGDGEGGRETIGATEAGI